MEGANHVFMHSHRDHASPIDIEDAFFANQNSPTNFFEGRKVTRLGNGDLVVAALVKNPNGSQGSEYWNIGLVRYNAAGTQRVSWPNGGVYAHAGGEYVVYPKDDSATITSIGDVKAINGKIFVLHTARVFQGDLGNSYDQIRIVGFTEGGSQTSTAAPWFSRIFQAAGALAAYSSGGEHFLMAVGTRYAEPGGSFGRPVFTRFKVEANGALTNVTGTVDLNTSGCWRTDWECHATGIALGGLAQQNIYVSYAFRENTTTQDWNIVVSRITIDGAGSSTWDPNNFVHQISDGGNRRDWPVDIAVRTFSSGIPATFRDQIFVTSESARNCQPGIGLLKLNQDGGREGSTIVGGNNSSGICVLARPSEYPKAIAINGSRVAVAGYSRTPALLIGDEARDDSTLAILDTNLVLRDFGDYTFPIYGPRNRHSHLWDIVTTTDGRFVAVGDNRLRNSSDVPVALRGKTSVTLLGLAADRLFGDGFGSAIGD